MQSNDKSCASATIVLTDCDGGQIEVTARGPSELPQLAVIQAFSRLEPGCSNLFVLLHDLLANLLFKDANGYLTLTAELLLNEGEHFFTDAEITVLEGILERIRSRATADFVDNPEFW